MSDTHVDGDEWPRDCLIPLRLGSSFVNRNPDETYSSISCMCVHVLLERMHKSLYTCICVCVRAWFALITFFLKSLYTCARVRVRVCVPGLL